MKKIFFIINLLLCTCLTFAQTRNLKLVQNPIENPTDQKRKAIVIGMSDYGIGKNLSNTLNDADDMAEVLTRLGFQVTLLKDNDFMNLKTNLTNWYNTITGNDMAVFYFAGHGMEVNGTNYLIPIGVQLNSQTDVEYNALNVNQVIGNMDEKRVGMKLLILDACRDNPFARNWTRGNSSNGLAQMAAPHGTFIAFAAAPGAVAQDGRSHNLRNGVFTHYLKQEILKSGASIDQIFNNVAGSVSNLTSRQQIPFRNSSLAGNFYFIPPRSYDNPNPVPIPTPTPKKLTIGQQHTITVFIEGKEHSIGGIIAYLDSSGQHGLLLSKDDAKTGTTWTWYTAYPWRIPTKEELELLYKNKGSLKLYGTYWSSTKKKCVNGKCYYVMDFSTGKVNVRDTYQSNLFTGKRSHTNIYALEICDF